VWSSRGEIEDENCDTYLDISYEFSVKKLVCEGLLDKDTQELLVGFYAKNEETCKWELIADSGNNPAYFPVVSEEEWEEEVGCEEECEEDCDKDCDKDESDCEEQETKEECTKEESKKDCEKETKEECTKEESKKDCEKETKKDCETNGNGDSSNGSSGCEKKKECETNGNGTNGSNGSTNGCSKNETPT
jgi:hypothetical protein